MAIPDPFNPAIAQFVIQSSPNGAQPAPVGNAFEDQTDSGEETPESFYEDYGIENTHDFESGILQMPIADNTTDGSTSCELVQVFAPYGQRVVTVKGKRWGAIPELPDPTQLAPRDVLLRSKVSMLAPPFDPKGGIQMCTLEGTFVFASTNPRMPGLAPLPNATIPFTTDDKEDNDFPSTNWVDDLVSTSDSE